MEHSQKQNSTQGFFIFADDSAALGEPKLSLSITAKLSKNGGSAAAVSLTITEIEAGVYWVAPIAAHRDTLGRVCWFFSATDATIAPRFEKIVAIDDQDADFGVNPDDYKATGFAEPGDEMGLTAATIAELFSDADMTTLTDAIVSRVESDLDASDLSVQAVAAHVVSQMLLSANDFKADITSLATASALAAAQVVLDRYDALLENVSGDRFVEHVLSEAPSGGGGGGSSQEHPLSENC